MKPTSAETGGSSSSCSSSQSDQEAERGQDIIRTTTEERQPSSEDNGDWDTDSPGETGSMEDITTIQIEEDNENGKLSSPGGIQHFGRWREKGIRTVDERLSEKIDHMCFEIPSSKSLSDKALRISVALQAAGYLNSAHILRTWERVCRTVAFVKLSMIYFSLLLTVQCYISLLHSLQDNLKRRILSYDPAVLASVEAWEFDNDNAEICDSLCRIARYEKLQGGP